VARERYPLPGRVVLITGAARGIGAEAARQLADRGARIALVGLEPELLEQRAAELGPQHCWFEADVCDRDALDAAVAGTVERMGGIDVVVANAGVASSGPIATIDEETFERTIEVNLLGVWRTVRAALPHVVARRGYVLTVASVAAAVHLPLAAAYSMSKAGVEAFANCLRVELAHTGTKVGCAYFSFIDTDMVRRSFEPESTRSMRATMSGPFAATAPLPVAGRAIVRGIGHRSRHVVAPSWVLPVLFARTLVQPLGELRSIRSGVADAVRQAEGERAELTTPQALRPSR
jgi:NAD(P)-dependent dehydrogenase (short-subunit alcohol dehydrogenase family)